MENYEHTQIDEMITEEPEIEEKKLGPLDGLVKIYEESLAEMDAIGFADVYKTATEYFFQCLEKCLQERCNIKSFTPQDVEYGDGYFVFAHGTNSVIQFHVKEAPHWLFGIWWSPITEGENAEGQTIYSHERIRCNFFAQREELIDKFKPSDSTFVQEFDWDLKEQTDSWYGCFCAVDVVQLILKHPIVAFARELCWLNLNVDYISPEEAYDIYENWFLKESQKEKMKQENLKAVLDCLRYIFKPLFDCGDAFFEDRGEGWCPRYQLVLRNIWKEDQGDEESQDGCFDLFNFGVIWLDLEYDKALYDRTIDECKERAKNINEYWYNSVSDNVCIVSGKKYLDAKAKYELKEEE